MARGRGPRRRRLGSVIARAAAGVGVVLLAVGTLARPASSPGCCSTGDAGHDRGADIDTPAGAGRCRRRPGGDPRWVLRRSRRLLPRAGQRRRAGRHRAHALRRAVHDHRPRDRHRRQGRVGLRPRGGRRHPDIDHHAPRPVNGTGRLSAHLVPHRGLGGERLARRLAKDRAIGIDNFVVLRSEIVGGNGGIYCRLDCTIQDSWIHGTDLDPDSEWHASAIRVEQHGTLIHNTLACDYAGPFNNPEIGCSADMTGYADFAPITGNTIGRTSSSPTRSGSATAPMAAAPSASRSRATRRTPPISCSPTTCSSEATTASAGRGERSPTSWPTDRATCGRATAGPTAPRFRRPDSSARSPRCREKFRGLQSAGPGVANNIPATR